MHLRITRNYLRKVKITRVKGKIVSREVIDLDPIIVDGGNHWRVSNHHRCFSFDFK